MTESIRYKSIYSDLDKKVTPAQYIVELVCSNNADKNNIEIPKNFWKLKQWKAFYLFQMKYATSLLKTYPSDFLVSYIRSKKIWSLKAKWIYDDIPKEFKIWKAKNSKTLKRVETVENPTFRSKKNLNLDLLD